MRDQLAPNIEIGSFYESSFVSPGGSAEVDVVVAQLGPKWADRPASQGAFANVGAERALERLFPDAQVVRRVGPLTVEYEDLAKHLPGALSALMTARDPFEAKQFFNLTGSELRESNVLNPELVKFLERVAYGAPIAIQQSPLTVGTLAGAITKAAGIGGIAFVAGNPFLAIPLAAGVLVVSAFWAGARPEVEDFAGDATAAVLDRIRARLGIDRRN